MIRRWSCINAANSLLSNVKTFEKIAKVNIFKNTINYKRFTFKITKFKRKALIRVKHKTNWLLYTNIIRLWVKDYLFNRHFLKMQANVKVHLSHFYFYNFNFIKNQRGAQLYNFNFVFSTWSKKSYNYFHPNACVYLKFSPLVFAWFDAAALIDKTVVPVYTEIEKSLFVYDDAQFFLFDFNQIFDFHHFMVLQKIIEIRKILAILFYNNICKFGNVK